ncbi:hypothetical protein EV359DRAFT_82871 [Lentinula novae-zelandiae]|nr:hypothetical protein EV359DRAFT_82871 [Lentinula novae-zelandiae]
MLLPLFTLAVHVAATSHDSIPLHDLPPPTYPEAVHLVHQGHDEPPPYTEAPGSNNPMPPAYLPTISTSFNSHRAQPPSDTIGSGGRIKVQGGGRLCEKFI